MTKYTRDFQINLLAHLARDREFFERTRSYLRLTDFDLPACQLVLETLQDYFKRVGQLPNMTTLQTHLMYMMQQSFTATNLLPEEYQSLAYIVEVIARLELATPYYAAQLPEYLKFVRMTQVVAANVANIQQGQGLDDFANQIAGVQQSIGTHSDIVLDSMTANPEPFLTETANVRISTGLNRLDRFTGRGLGLGEIGMVTACPGVGKTTSLINFMVGAVGAGHRALFLTLELTGRRIKHRYQSIAGYIDAGWLKLPMTKWPDAELERYEAIVSPTHKHFDYVQLVDLSKKSYSTEDINRSIGLWFEDVDRKYHEADKCTCVYVDWLDKIDPAGLSTNRNDRDDKVLVKVAEKLAELARKYNVAMWTATQGTREADGVERLSMKHTAYGYHKNDPLDVSLGLGPVITPQVAAQAQTAATTGSDGKDDDDELAPPCSRDLVFNIMKNRDNAPGMVHFYQGNTLKYWNLKADATQTTANIAEYGLAALQDVYAKGGI